MSKAQGATTYEKTSFTSTYTIFISQISRQPERLPLLCIEASAGLSTSVRGSIDKDALALALAKARGKVVNFRDNQKIILAQKVGWWKE